MYAANTFEDFKRVVIEEARRANFRAIDETPVDPYDINFLVVAPNDQRAGRICINGTEQFHATLDSGHSFWTMAYEPEDQLASARLCVQILRECHEGRFKLRRTLFGRIYVVVAVDGEEHFSQPLGRRWTGSTPV